MKTNIIEKLCKEGRDYWSNNIKMLLYKQNEDIFDVIDFDNEYIYSDPLLFAYYNNVEDISTNQNILNTILFYGLNRNQKITIQLDKYEKTYLSNVGWLNNSNKIIIDIYKGQSNIEEIHKIPNTDIEILKSPIGLLDTFYEGNNVEITKITKKQINNLTKAYFFIKKVAPEHFNLINQYAKKCVIFETNPNNINSFAHRGALGIAFFNAYQSNYDEVFFIDDIAHQTGHVLMHTILFDKKKIFKIDDENTKIQDYSINTKNIKDTRNVEVWFQALFTYYASFLCLDKCIEGKVFDEKQEFEAIGRILLYIYKCYYDLSLIGHIKQDRKLFDRIIEPIKKSSNEDSIFSKDGQIIFNIIFNKYSEIFNKYYPKYDALSFKNQSYNFDFNIFIQENPSLQ